MSNLYDGLPPPIAKSEFLNLELNSELSTEEKDIQKNKERFSSWGRLIDTFVETTKNKNILSNELIEVNFDETQIDDLDLDYNPRIPNIYDQITYSKQETLEEPKSPINNKNESKDNLFVGKKLLEKMGWKQGEGLGKNKQGIKDPISIVQNSLTK